MSEIKFGSREHFQRIEDRWNELKAENERLRAALQAIADGMWDYNSTPTDYARRALPTAEAKSPSPA